jgi:hypothetical protein
MNSFDSFQRTQKRMIKTLVAIWAVYAILWLAFWGTIAFVVGHFLLKWW